MGAEPPPPLDEPADTPRAAVAVPADEDLAELVEDLRDTIAILRSELDEARTGRAPVPWEQVKAELGL